MKETIKQYIQKNTQVKNSRLEYLDAARGLLILFVILGHTVPTNSAVKTWIYAFHMPAFFILSGMVFKDKDETIKQYAYKMFQKLMIPYFVWGLIYTKLSVKNMLWLLYGSRETLVKADSLTSLWFLPVSFLCMCLIKVLVKWEKGNYAIMILTGIVSMLMGCVVPHYHLGLPWGADIVFMAMGFTAIGYGLQKIVEHGMNRWWKLLICGLLCSGIYYLTVKWNNPENGYILMAEAVYGNSALFVLSSLSGIGIVLVAAKMICHLIQKKKWLLLLGQNTLGVFLLHKPLVQSGRSVMNLLFGSRLPVLQIAVIGIGSGLLSLCLSLVLKDKLPGVLGTRNRRMDTNE